MAWTTCLSYRSCHQLNFHVFFFFSLTQIYDTMKRYNLGIEEATKTIVVSKALRRAMASGSPAEAIELLASKISLRNLLYDSPDEDPTSDIRPELRVEPLSRMDLQPTSRRAKSTPVRKPKTPLKVARARTKTPSKNVMAGRKRSIEEIASVEKKDSTWLQKHDRSDSLGAEVDAKIAKQSNDEAPANEPPMRPTPNVRAKRVHRAEEAETISQTANTHNRTRGSEG
jgi:hypothetical protein